MALHQPIDFAANQFSWWKVQVLSSIRLDNWIEVQARIDELKSCNSDWTLIEPRDAFNRGMSPSSFADLIREEWDEMEARSRDFGAYCDPRDEQRDRFNEERWEQRMGR